MKQSLGRKNRFLIIIGNRSYTSFNGWKSFEEGNIHGFKRHPEINKESFGIR